MAARGRGRSGVRIVAGRFGGLRLETLPGYGVRPTADRVKEALFSMLASRLPGATVADCFAGTGALGIEALSRGAARAVFVERDPGSLSLLRRNLERLPEPVDARVVAADALRPVLWGRDLLPVDLVLADPPYREDLARPFLRALAEAGAVRPDGWVAMEHEPGVPLADPGWEPVRERRYGDTVITILRPAEVTAKGDSHAQGDLSGDI
jgi:16S rRNA (guanine966-N2)-methyltransferase